MKLFSAALGVLGLAAVVHANLAKVMYDDVGVMHFQEKHEERQVDLSPRRLMSGNVFTSNDKLQILNAHNTDRSTTALGSSGTQPMATDMTQMIWNEDLAKVAAAYAAKCIWGHSSNPYGENLYVSFSDDASMENIDTILSGIDGWYKEYQYYTYSSRSCASGKMCGHYTQVVWGKSLRVGCGYAICDPQTMMGYNYDYAVYLVCNYDPPGNYNGQYPYTKAASSASIATSCPSGYYSNPSNGLCMRNDGSTGIDSSPTSPTTKAPTTSTGSGVTTTKSSTTTKIGTTTTSGPGSCTTCSVKWRVAYVTSSWSTVSQLVWSNALTTVKGQTKNGYNIAGSYGSTYFDITVTTYSNNDAVTLLNYVGGSTYKTQLNAQISSYITAGSLVITTQPITSAAGAQAYTGEESSSESESSNDNHSTWWIWLVALFIGLVVGFASGLGYAYWKGKQKEQEKQSYVKMVDYVAQ